MNTLSQIREREKSRLIGYKVLEDDAHQEKHGVLLSDEIKYYISKANLIDPFQDRFLKPAGYELTVGDEFYLGGDYQKLRGIKDNNEIIIPPFDLAVIKTSETLNMPRFLIGRWSLRVHWVYKGLLWTGAPQVDPGYVGHLYCPIYNLSNKPVRIPRGDPIALIDFVKTTPFDKSKDEEILKRYDPPDKRIRIVIQDYGAEELGSALYDLAIQKIGFMEEKVEKMLDRFSLLVAVIFAGLGIVMAGVFAVLFKDEAWLSGFKGGLAALSIGISTFAVLISIFHFISDKALFYYQANFRVLLPDTARYSRKRFWKYWWIGSSMSVLLSVFVSLLVLRQLGVY